MGATVWQQWQLQLPHFTLIFVASGFNDASCPEPAFFVYLPVIIFTSIDFVTGLKKEVDENRI
jgi:hypothetical protein